MASGAATSPITARFLLPDLLQRGRANALSCPLWSDGALVAPSSGTITIYDGSSTEQVAAAAVVVSASIATYSYTPAATLAYGESWRVEWSLVVAGATDVYPNDAAVVRNVLHPVVTDSDLYRRHRALDPASASPLSTVSNYQDYLDEAWGTISLRLISRGNRPNLIISPSALRDVHLLLTLALIFEDFSTSLNESFGERAEDYRRRYASAWGDLGFVYAAADDADTGGTARRKAASPSVWLTGRH